jgi:hypothetical protein
MGSQGRSLTESQVDRIVSLLTSTEMSITQIAARMGCSRSAVGAVNRKFRIREYSGCRVKWKVRPADDGSVSEYRYS